MYPAQQRNKYLEATVHTATPAQLLLLLMDGAVRFSKLGLEAMKQQDRLQVDHYLMKTVDIIEELLVTLQQQSSVAPSLIRLYEYFIHLLSQGMAHQDENAVEELIGYLVDLKETWMQAAKQVQSRNGVVSHA